MPLSYTEHYRFGIPDFLSEPWHADWHALVHHIDHVLYQAVVLNSTIPWLNSYAFVVGDIVMDLADGRLWTCSVAHVSSVTPVTFAQDRAANPTYWTLFASAPDVSIEIIIDGGGANITGGIKADLEVPFGATITKVTLLANTSGNIVIDIWRDSYGNYPPDSSDSITALAKPTLSGVAKSQDSTLVNWNKTINAGDTLRFNVVGSATVQRVTLSLTCQRT